MDKDKQINELQKQIRELKDDCIEKKEKKKDIIITEKNTIYEDQYDYDIQKPKSRCKRFLLCFSKSNIN